MYMCKQGQGKGGSAFIRMVNAAPYPMMVMALDNSLDVRCPMVLALFVWTLATFTLVLFF